MPGPDIPGFPSLEVRYNELNIQSVMQPKCKWKIDEHKKLATTTVAYRVITRQSTDHGIVIKHTKLSHRDTTTDHVFTFHSTHVSAFAWLPAKRCQCNCNLANWRLEWGDEQRHQPTESRWEKLQRAPATKEIIMW